MSVWLQAFRQDSASYVNHLLVSEWLMLFRYMAACGVQHEAFAESVGQWLEEGDHLGQLQLRDLQDRLGLFHGHAWNSGRDATESGRT